MTKIKRILFVDNVVSVARNNIRPREHREVDTILNDKSYKPYMVVSEPVLINKPKQFFESSSFVDSRIEVYHVPSLAIGSLSSNRSLGKFGRLMFGISNLAFQMVYFLHLILFVLSLTLAKRIDILHAHNPPDLTGLASLFVSKITGVPYIFEIHDRAPELYCGEMGLKKSSIVFKLMKSIEYLVIKNSAGVITVNERVAQYFKQYGGPSPVAIYTGTKLNLDLVRTGSLENIVGNKRIILYQGALNMTTVGSPAIYDLMLPLKAMPFILEKVPDVVLVYVGEGSGRSTLEKTAKSMGLQDKVIFTGFIPQKQVFEWINAASITLIPYADNPNCRTTVPSKLYEYMAVGKPIIATKFPGITEVLDDGRNGLLYEVTSVDDFISCVLRILNNSEFAARLSLNAKNDFFSKYSIEKNWPRLISLYDSISS